MVRRTSLTSTHCTRNYVFDERASGIKWRVGKEADTKNTAATAVRKESRGSLCLSTSRFPGFFSSFRCTSVSGFNEANLSLSFFYLARTKFSYICLYVYLSSFHSFLSLRIQNNVSVVALFRIPFLCMVYFFFFPVLRVLKFLL